MTIDGQACEPGHCVTCGDDGVRMTVLDVDRGRGLALCVDQDGGHHTVETALVEPVSAGAQLLVHAGTAIASLAAHGPLDRPAPFPGHMQEQLD